MIKKESWVKALTNEVKCLKARSQKLDRKNENLWVSKQEIISFPIILSRPKGNGKAINKLVKGLEDQCVGIGIQMEYMSTSWYLTEAADVHYFSNHARFNWA